MNRAHGSASRRYPRMARVNELLREIVGDELERLDVTELAFVTVTGVDCSADLRRATVYFDGPDSAEADAATVEAFGDVRTRLQRAIATQARLKHTPELRFEPDPAVRSGEHIDAVLRAVAVARPSAQDDGDDDADGPR